ncbi:MAG: hypothetical protein Q8927_09410 [Bacteroidota bacterium]|nr:hypothetical protein [Bacteroidota bacterium]MDP4216407.1 hypothetical protein [Bacteroidota bacterium]MDP4244967.1 hypothetical protein [Bacteroidota bacterium]MDP4252523.1 hypothetical protein [Bacteroidota bacterium]
MKRTLSLIFLLPGLALTAQVKLPADSLRAALLSVNPDSSAIGKPVGNLATKTIGPGGGTIISADSMMELTFPAGALAVPTEIGIQPVENTSIAGFGNTYACTPDGMRFQKPVQLLIHYTDSAAKGISPRKQTILWQDKTGKWSRVEKVEADSANRRISCVIEHFSGYSAANAGTQFKIIPRNNRVKVNREHVFMLVISGPYPDGKNYASGFDANATFWKTQTVEWSVDGIVGGNDITGRIKLFASDQQNAAIYTAPPVVPATPVEIRAKYIGLVPMGLGSFSENVTSIAAADIYDEFRYSFRAFDKVGHLHMDDSAICNIQVFSSGKVQLSDIKNPVPWSDWPQRLGDCSYTYPDKTGWKGLAEIAGMQSGNYSRNPASPASAQVQIQLIPTMGSSPRYMARCKGRTNNVPSMPVMASPGSIQFEPLTDGNIRIHYGGAQGDNTLSKFTTGDQGFAISVSHIP